MAWIDTSETMPKQRCPDADFHRVKATSRIPAEISERHKPIIIEKYFNYVDDPNSLRRYEPALKSMGICIGVAGKVGTNISLSWNLKILARCLVHLNLH